MPQSFLFYDFLNRDTKNNVTTTPTTNPAANMAVGLICMYIYIPPVFVKL